jgi:hypothetical protein
VANAVFAGQPKDIADAYLPQCCIWILETTETVELAGYAGRAYAEFEARVQVLVDLHTEWYAGEQQILAIRDALWPALLRHERLGGTVPTVVASEARPTRGLRYEQIAGVDYRCFESGWRVCQQWSIASGLGV